MLNKLILSLMIFVLFIGSGSALFDNYEQTINGYLDDLTSGTSSYLIEKGKSKDLYLPRRVVDNDTNTSWVEGRSDEGNGEYLIVNLKGIEIAKTMSILPGFARNDSLYFANNRPKDIRLLFFQSTGKQLDLIKSISDFEKHNIKITNNVRFVLKDLREFQKIELPDYSTYFKKYPDIRMAIIIESVYRGIKHNDTCITEIRFYNEKGIDLIKLETDNIIQKNKGNR